MALLAATGNLACATATTEPSRWQRASNIECLVWNQVSDPGERVTWSGGCVGGKAEGSGTKVFHYRVRGVPVEQRYVGEMRAGKNQGHGTLYNVDGERFDGEWVDGQRVRGTETYANGVRYVGTYRDDKASGVGTLTYPNGARYSGDFINAQFEGQGKFTEADGSYYVGEFRRGLPNGYGTLHLRDGRFISGNWSGGCLRDGTQVATAGVAKENCGFR